MAGYRRVSQSLNLVCDSQDFSRSASVMRQRIAMSSVSFCQQVKLIIKLKIKKKCPSFCCRLSEKYTTHSFTTVKSNRKERFMMQRIRADRLRSLRCHICARTQSWTSAQLFHQEKGWGRAKLLTFFETAKAQKVFVIFFRFLSSNTTAVMNGSAYTNIGKN